MNWFTRGKVIGWRRPLTDQSEAGQAEAGKEESFRAMGEGEASAATDATTEIRAARIREMIEMYYPSEAGQSEAGVQSETGVQAEAGEEEASAATDAATESQVASLRELLDEIAMYDPADVVTFTQDPAEILSEDETAPGYTEVMTGQYDPTDTSEEEADWGPFPDVSTDDDPDALFEGLAELFA